MINNIIDKKRKGIYKKEIQRKGNRNRIKGESKIARWAKDRDRR